MSWVGGPTRTRPRGSQTEAHLAPVVPFRLHHLAHKAGGRAAATRSAPRAAASTVLPGAPGATGPTISTRPGGAAAATSTTRPSASSRRSEPSAAGATATATRSVIVMRSVRGQCRSTRAAHPRQCFEPVLYGSGVHGVDRMTLHGPDCLRDGVARGAAGAVDIDGAHGHERRARQPHHQEHDGEQRSGHRESMKPPAARISRHGDAARPKTRIDRRRVGRLRWAGRGHGSSSKPISRISERSARPVASRTRRRISTMSA